MLKKCGQILSVLIILPLIVLAQQNNADPVRVFYLGGQSNMDGYGYTKDLPESLNKTFENVWIFHGNSAPDDKAAGGMGKWSLLQPGHGTGFSSDGVNNTYSDRFGIELSMASRLQELLPGEKIALVKYSRGGTSIDSLAAERFSCRDQIIHFTIAVNIAGAHGLTDGG